jgi:hypothetical protein
MDLLNRRDEMAPPLFRQGRGMASPGVVAGLGHLQGLAGPRDGAVAAVVGDEAEGQFGGLAK